MKRFNPLTWMLVISVGVCVVPTTLHSISYVFALKTDSTGEVLWQKTLYYKGSGGFNFGDVAQISPGRGAVIAGVTKDEGKYALYLLMLDSLGNELWTRTYPSEYPYSFSSVIQTHDSGFLLLAGVILRIDSVSGPGSVTNEITDMDIWLTKTDSMGNALWTKTYGGSYIDDPTCVRECDDGGYLITCNSSLSPIVNKSLWLVKTDSLGDTLWTKLFSDTCNAFGYYISNTISGNCIISGSKNITLWMLKVDSKGGTIWDKTFDFGEAHSVHETRDGCYIVASQIFHNLSYFDLIKVDPNGNLLWSKRHEGYFPRACLTSDGGYIVTGENANDAWLLKTDSLGNLEWSRSYVLGNASRGYWVGQTPDGGYLITGLGYKR